jgi:hypothetical protein
VTGSQCGLYAVTLLDWTPIFEWYVAWFVVEDGNQRDVLQWDWTHCIDTVLG